MKDINILINNDDPKNHKVIFDDDYAGINGENLQGNIVFKFKNFVEGQARAEIIIDNQDGYIELEQVDDTYTMPIKSSLLTSDFIIMQLVIDEPATRSAALELPVWKSEAFTLKVGYSINATSTIPEDYPTWIEILDDLRTQTEEAIEKASNVNISSEQLTDGVKVITTNQDGEQTITIVPQGPQGEPGVPGAVKFVIVNELPTEDIQTDTIYLVPSDDPTTQDLYLEYMYINNQWELLGQKQIVVDLTNYVQFTDHATSNKPGVAIVNSYYGVDMSYSGALLGSTKTYAQYNNTNYFNDSGIICKGTLENVITGKGLVSNTDWASSSTGGIIKLGGTGETFLGGSNQLVCLSKTYAQYQDMNQYGFISKGTLENVLTARIGDISSVLDAINGEVI